MTRSFPLERGRPRQERVALAVGMIVVSGFALVAGVGSPLGGGSSAIAASISATGAPRAHRRTALLDLSPANRGQLLAALARAQSIGQFSQQGPKLTGSDEAGDGLLGASVALSADGNTAIMGAAADDGFAGAAWVFKRSGDVWTQQGPKLTPSDGTEYPTFGQSVALSADGNNALIGGPGDTGSFGAAWAFTRSGGVWTQQGPRLTAADNRGQQAFGSSVALSADGDTALIGGPAGNNSFVGAAWVFTRSGGMWHQQGPKLSAAGLTAASDYFFGYSVALSADGNTALIGDPLNGSGVGAAWVFTQSAGVWIQQGSKLTPGDGTSIVEFGTSVALSANGNTALVGGPLDGPLIGNGVGAAWAFTRSGGVWTQQGPKLTGNDEAAGEVGVGFGTSVALSADGNVALVGGQIDNDFVGAAWVFNRSGGVWAQNGPKLTANDEVGQGSFGFSVALSADAKTALIGGPEDASGTGAAWVFTGSATRPPPPSRCKGSDAALIGARGSGDNSNGDAYPGRHAEQIAELLGVEQWHLKLFDDDSRSDGVIGLLYPAIDIAPPWNWPKYTTSVNTGADHLIGEIRRVRALCGSSFPILLAGYSQGANVIQNVLDTLDSLARTGDSTWRSIAGIALIASPRFVPWDWTGRGTFVADYPAKGLLGDLGIAPDAAVPARFNSITRSYCLNGDPVCAFDYFNTAGFFTVHSHGYDPGSGTGEPILEDAAGLLAWEVSSRKHTPASPNPEGALAAYGLGNRGRLGPTKFRVSAAAVYARGAPTTQFRWDFTSDGSVDAVTTLPYAEHDYGQGHKLNQQIITTVTIDHADGTHTTRTLCLLVIPTGYRVC